MVKKILAIQLVVFLFINFAGFVMAGDQSTDTITSRNRYIKYIPKDHSIEMVRAEETFRLVGVAECQRELTQNKAQCDICKNIWGDANCPDCCFDQSNLKPSLDCTKDVDDKYNCGDKTPFVSCKSSECMECLLDKDCSSAEISSQGLCQRLCCKVDLTEVEDYGCKRDETGNWFCKKELPTKDLSQKNRPCTVNSNVSDCFSYTNPYDFQGKVEDSKDCPDNVEVCYEYKVNSKFKKCVASCKEQTNAWDQCQKNIYCCEKNRCPNSSSQTCNAADCKTRLDSKNKLCNTLYNSENCNKWYEEYSKFSLGSSGEGELQTCFKEINSKVFYKFIGRGDEDIVVTWQILVRNLNKNVDENFLSMVKIFDATRLDAPIHESIVHQKAFSADFFINSATTIPRDKVKPGRAYVAKLYYYFPVQGVEKVSGKINQVALQMQVDDVQLIIIRNRN